MAVSCIIYDASGEVARLSQHCIVPMQVSTTSQCNPGTIIADLVMTPSIKALMPKVVFEQFFDKRTKSHFFVSAQ